MPREKKGSVKKMKPSAGRKDFIGFILAAEGDAYLLKQFMTKNTTEELYDFFQTEHFTDIKKEPDCQDILIARNQMADKTIPSSGGDPCPDENKGY
jgi:hypothetical protein